MTISNGLPYERTPQEHPSEESPKFNLCGVSVVVYQVNRATRGDGQPVCSKRSSIHSYAHATEGRYDLYIKYLSPIFHLN